MNERGCVRSLIARGRGAGAGVPCMGNGAGVQSDGVCARLVAMSMMSSLSAMCDHNDSIFVTFYPPPLLRMPTYCINDCDTRVSHKGNTCGTCMKAMKAAMKASGMENCNINIVNSLQEIAVATIVDQEWLTRVMCALLAQRH